MVQWLEGYSRPWQHRSNSCAAADKTEHFLQQMQCLHMCYMSRSRRALDPGNEEHWGRESLPKMSLRLYCLHMLSTEYTRLQIERAFRYVISVNGHFSKVS